MNMISRIEGTGELPPLLLHGHLDVVPVERDKWSVDPFGGIVKDGFVWGRGAVDMKNMVAMCARVMLLIKKTGRKPKRDIIFAAVADEEAGGAHGAAWLVENHPEAVRAEYAIGEMGGFSVEIGSKRVYLVQVAEKGVCWFKIRTHGQPGHGSVPDPQSAPAKLARAVAALSDQRLPLDVTPTGRAMIQGLASGVGGAQGAILKGLLNPVTEPLVHKILCKRDPDKAAALSATLHNTVGATILRAGSKINVIPSEAEAECDGRLVPGCSAEAFLEQVRRVIGPDADLEVIQSHIGAVAPTDDPIMEVFRESLLAHDPEGIVVPNLLTGFTDAGHWQKLGIKCYGFSPLRMPADLRFKDLVHGHDERVPIDGLAFGLRALYDAVYKIAM
jgi:acetylornithine deacetylase/succinyl-diaminopimelate desuccinylase-like protein